MLKSTYSTKGSALIAALIIIIVLTVGITASSIVSNSSIKVTADSKRKTSAWYAAESALNVARKNLFEMVKRQKTISPVQDSPSFEYNEFVPQGTYDRASFLSQCMEHQALDNEDNETAACEYLANRYELLPTNISDEVEVKIIGITRFDGNPALTGGIEENLRKTIGESYKIPKSDEASHLGNLYANREIYQIDVEALNRQEGTRANMSARIGAYSIPLFQFLMLTNYPLTISPRGVARFDLKGRVHTNAEAKLGIQYSWDQHFTISPLDFEEETKALTSSAGIWQVFKYIHMMADSSHDIHEYFKGSVRVETEEDEYEPFWNSETDTHFIHEENGYLGTDGYPYWWPCANNKDPECWADNHESTSGYFFELVEVDAGAAEFEGRLESNTPRIEPLWFSELSDPYEYIEPYNAVDSDLERENKVFYRSAVRVLRASNGNLVSLDENGNEITSGPLSIDNLTAVTGPAGSPVTPIIRLEPGKFYDPRLGRVADTIKFNMEQFRTRADMAGINSIYIGTELGPRGEIHYPHPACDPAYLNAGYVPICRDEDGNSCMWDVGCDPNTVGSFDAVVIEDATELPNGGITVTSNAPVMLHGDFNTSDPKSSLVIADNVTFLSNSWDENAWDPANLSMGPPVVAQDATYNLAYMDGAKYDADFQIPQIENWGNHTATRNISYVKFFESKYFPPKAGDFTVHNWDRSAFRNFFDPPNWINQQDVNLGTNPPPLCDSIYFVKLLSIEEK